MSWQTRYGGLEIEAVGRVTVVTLRYGQVLSGWAVEALGQQLGGLVAGLGGRHLVLNFGNVERLSSAVLAHVVALDREVRRAGGRLALCGLRPELADLLRITGLDRYLELYPSEGEAWQSLL
jgi:anti-anti-sigma factor